MFRARYESGVPQLLWTTTVSDLETPVSAFLKLAAGRPNSVLLESVEGGATRGRYSIIMLDPDLVWRVRGDLAEVNRFALTDPDGWRAEEVGALASLRRLLAESRVDVPPGLPPMSAGVVGYLAYDFVRRIERIPERNPDPLGVPDGILLRPTIVAVFDTVADTLTFATAVRPQPGVDADTARAAAEARLAAAAAAMARPLPPPPAAPAAPPDLGQVRSNMTQEAYQAAVAKAVEYIHAGDAFQIVPSQRFAVPFALPPFALYRSLRRLNPSPFLFFLDFGGFAVVGSSPEIMVRLREGIVTIRPLAGTRPRGATHEEDLRLEQDLLNDPKERAEHLMLLDLGRNDVGRVAAIGTVQVKEQFTVERYSHVMHISSHVEGRLRPGLDAVDALMAGFPAGTLSGAPKVRAMEIIEELEPERRGVYAGCIGYFAAGGDMDTCIGLRTAVVKDGTMYVQAGAGVVADSDPETEYQETVHKARALIRAAEEAVRFAAGAGR
ncbi:anthranilate synthase component I [Elioraea sp.]|uniref:anthranilate synthase component I n=1 Tax=Elioraea sp. TaxID=2185103 RepID=UPI003F704F1A